MTTTRTITFLSLVLEADKEHYEPDIGYEFSNSRTFKNSDKGVSGVYGGVTFGGEDITFQGDPDVRMADDKAVF